MERGLARVAGQSCLAGPSVLRLHPNFGYRPGWVYGREPCPESQVFFCRYRTFLAYHGPCGDFSPTRIVPGLIASWILTQHHVCLCSRTISSGQPVTAWGGRSTGSKEKRSLRTYPRLNFRMSRSMAAPSLPAKSVCRVSTTAIVHARR